MNLSFDLNTIWFILVGVLFSGYAVLDGFDLGVGALHLFSKTDHLLVCRFHFCQTFCHGLRPVLHVLHHLGGRCKLLLEGLAENLLRLAHLLSHIPILRQNPLLYLKQMLLKHPHRLIFGGFLKLL